MASAIEHYRDAERSIESAAEAEGRSDVDLAVLNLRYAAVHATLALAGATALQAYSSGDEPELDEWQAAAGGAG